MTRSKNAMAVIVAVIASIQVMVIFATPLLAAQPVAVADNQYVTITDTQLAVAFPGVLANDVAQRPVDSDADGFLDSEELTHGSDPGNRNSIPSVGIIVSTNTELASAVSAASAGDVIVMAEGSYTNPVQTISRSGTSGNPITIRSRTVGGAVIDGTSSMILGGSYLVLDGVSFTNGNPGDSQGAIRVNGSYNIVVNPADNATGVAVGANLVATFSRNIVRGSGNIRIRKLSDTTDTTIPVSDTTQVLIPGNILTINPTADLLPGTNYAVRIDDTAIDDTDGNSFAGITDDTIWNFATASPDLAAPTLVDTDSAAGGNTSTSPSNITLNHSLTAGGNVLVVGGYIDNSGAGAGATLIFGGNAPTGRISSDRGTMAFYKTNALDTTVTISLTGNASSVGLVLWELENVDLTAGVVSAAGGDTITTTAANTFVLGTGFRNGSTTISRAGAVYDTTDIAPFAILGNAGVTGSIGGASGLAETAGIQNISWNSDADGSALAYGFVAVTTIQTQYQAWAGGAAFDADSNNDGVANGLAWLLGAANPAENALNKLPAATRNGATLRLTFRRLKSTKRGGAVLKVQSSSDLGLADPWTSHEAAVPDVDGTINGVFFDTTDDGDSIHVIADIPAPGTGLFARLSAVNAP